MKALWILLGAMVSTAYADEPKETHYCISADRGYKTVVQCQNGTVTVVDNTSEKVVVCSTNPSDQPRCQALPFGSKQ